MNATPHISICVATYQRPLWLGELLRRLVGQQTNGEFTFEIVVTDNDAAQSAREVVAVHGAASQIPLVYSVESRRSISYARNEGLARASGGLIAFVDDDELPCADWLLQLFHALQSHKVAGVLGPVRPHFEAGAPGWVIKGGFYDRPEHETGYEMPWTECRTGNVLLDRRIIAGLDPVFSPEFGTGGSDVDFFRRMTLAGHRFVWCNEAIVHEIVPPNRWKRTVLMRRALLRGRNSLRHPQGRWRRLIKAVIAIPLYALALPFLAIAGHHLLMRYVIKLCDHVGRLLAAIGITPVRERAM